MSRSFPVGLGAALLLWVFAADANAFCRMRTCDRTDPDADCAIDSAGCNTSGKPLYWPSACVGFSVQKDGSPLRDIDADTLADLAKRAFSSWESADCDGEAPSIGFEELDAATCDRSEFNPNGHNANLIVFRDDEWPYVGAIDVYGITRVRFDAKTGAIVDADIELNSADFELSADGDSDGVDLESVLTHEVGHFLGLDHASDDDDAATMTAEWDGDGTSLRTLDEDDDKGLCAIYPADRSAASSSCEPKNGFASACGVPVTGAAEPANPPADDGGCAFGSRAPDRASSAAFAAAVALLLNIRRRRAAESTRALRG